VFTKWPGLSPSHIISGPGGYRADEMMTMIMMATDGRARASSRADSEGLPTTARAAHIIMMMKPCGGWYAPGSASATVPVTRTGPGRAGPGRRSWLTSSEFAAHGRGGTGRCHCVGPAGP
jgi:hypothetical protein